METQDNKQQTLSERAVDLSRKASIALIASGSGAAMAAPPDVTGVVTEIGLYAAGIGLIGAAWMGINALIGGIRKMNAAARG